MSRTIYCEVTDEEERAYRQTLYAYDAFGRRVLVQDKDESALRTLYDGLTFDVIKQSPVYSSGLFADSMENGIRWGIAGKPTGDRYRYLDDDSGKDNNRYYYLDEGTYKTVTSRYRKDRTEFYINGSITGQVTSDYGAEYFSTDLLGSIRCSTDSYGLTKTSYTYDAFGTLVQGAFSEASYHGYLGKSHDPTANLYNYGFRDYNPVAARFTTPDPLRDGPNWFTYCHSDPVNFIDLFGLMDYDSVLRALTSSAIVVVTYDGNTNINGAQTGTMRVYSLSNNLSSRNVNIPDVVVPIVSGNKVENNEAPAYTNGLTVNKKQESVQTSKNPILKDKNHGGDKNTMIRLDSNGNSIHQGNSLSNQERAYSEGCISVTGNDEKPDVEENYNSVKKAIGDSNVVVITKNKTSSMCNK